MQLLARFPIESIDTAWQGQSKEGRTDILVRTSKGEISVWIDVYLVILYNEFLGVSVPPSLCIWDYMSLVIKY